MQSGALRAGDRDASLLKTWGQEGPRSEVVGCTVGVAGAPWSLRTLKVHKGAGSPGARRRAGKFLCSVRPSPS